ncbi:hypothetical protein HNP40_000327 [Mycobacteroides chelonae]|nr:hypothetical protein [Mycobacteroides chelonae]
MAIEELEDLNLVSQDLLIGHTDELEKFQWFVRAHLENSGGQLSHRDAHNREAGRGSGEEVERQVAEHPLC